LFDIFPKWKNIHKTCTINEFRETLNSIKHEILKYEFGDDLHANVSIVDGQTIIRSRVGRVIIFSVKELNLCFNEYSNSDWNCVQDKTTFVMANQIKSFRPPSEVSIDVELWL
jgi:hypothetical protein